MISRIDHISLAVTDLEKAKRFFMDVLGAIPCTNAEDGRLRYYWEIFALGDLSRMELIKATGEGSFLENFLKSRTNGVHHIQVQTPDINEFRDMLEEKGIPYFGFREAGETYKELFVHPRDAFGLLIQAAELEPDVYLSDAVKMPPDRRWAVEKTETGLALTLAHPGGGKVCLEFNQDEVQSLIKDLRKAVES